MRLKITLISTPEAPATARTAPATGEAQRPMEVASCIGTATAGVIIPTLAQIPGTKGPNAYQEAFPLPSKIPASNNKQQRNYGQNCVNARAIRIRRFRSFCLRFLRIITPVFFVFSRKIDRKKYCKRRYAHQTDFSLIFLPGG